jgi:hypothetical protein
LINCASKWCCVKSITKNKSCGRTQNEWYVTTNSNKQLNRYNQIFIEDNFFFCNPRCPGQLTRTTTNLRIYWTPCKPSRQVRHRGDDRRARWDSNPGDRSKETLSLSLDHKPRCYWGQLLMKSKLHHSEIAASLSSNVFQEKEVILTW